MCALLGAPQPATKATDNYAIKGWVTIHGAHVLIGDDGTITQGPAHLIGLKPKSIVAHLKPAVDAAISAHPALANVGVKKSTGTKLNNAQYAYVKAQVLADPNHDVKGVLDKMLSTPGTHQVQTAAEVEQLVDARHPAAPPEPEKPPAVPLYGQDAKDAIAEAIVDHPALTDVGLKKSTGTKLNNAQYAYMKQQVGSGVDAKVALGKMLTTPDTHKMPTAVEIDKAVSERHGDGEGKNQEPSLEDKSADAPGYQVGHALGQPVIVDKNGVVTSGHPDLIGKVFDSDEYQKAANYKPEPAPEIKPPVSNTKPTAEQISESVKQAVAMHPSVTSLSDVQTKYLEGQVQKGASATEALQKMLDTKYTKAATSVADIEQKVNAKFPPPPPPTFTIVKGWEQIGPQGGSNPGGVFKDDTGTSHYVKFYGSESQAQNEKLANDIYETLGVNAPTSKLVSIGGKVAIASEMVPAKGMSAAEMATHADVRKGFLADAFLANHDVVGLSNDNIVNSLGKAVRIDNGGAMFYRAQGDAKVGYDGKVKEIETMRNPAIAHEAGAVFSKLSEADLKPQAEKLVATLTSAKIASLVADAGFKGAEAAKYVSTLSARRDDIANRFGIDLGPKWEGESSAKSGVDGHIKAWVSSSDGNPPASKLRVAANLMHGNDPTVGMKPHDITSLKYTTMPSSTEVAAFKDFHEKQAALWDAKFPSGRTLRRGISGPEASVISNLKPGQKVSMLQPLISTTANSHSGFGATKVVFDNVKGEHVFSSIALTPHLFSSHSHENETIIFGNDGKWQFVGKVAGEYHFEHV